MAFNLITLSDALKKPLDSTINCAIKVLEIGDFVEYRNKEGDTRRYRVVKVADATECVLIRAYNTKLLTNLEAGKCYMFQNLLRKAGEHHLWCVSLTKSCDWASFEIPDTLTLNRQADITTLAEAIISSGTSNIKAKIVQTSPLKYVRNGELPIRFVRLMDEQEGPRVKVALFGNDAEKEFTIGDVLEITNTYKYKGLATLSTKQTSKIEFLPQDSISIDTVDLTFPEDNDFKDDVTNSVEPEEFSLMGISSAQVYACCVNTSCHNKKLDSQGVCQTCNKAPLTQRKFYAAAVVYMVRSQGIVEQKLFLDQLKKMFEVPELTDTTDKTLKAILKEQLPVNGRARFRNGSFILSSIKRKAKE